MKIYNLIFALLITMINFGFANEISGKGEISGLVLSSSNQNFLSGVTVRIVGTDLGAITKSDGKFTIKNIPNGIYAVKFTSIGFETYVESNVQISSAKQAQVKVMLVDKTIQMKGVEARGSYFQKTIESSTSAQSFSSEEIRRAPGAQEDVIRAISLLPGVGVTKEARNDLVVRGGAPYENLFIVDNIEIPNINHFGSQGSTGGPLTLVNIDFVKKVEFSAGGFGVKYGDKASSLTNLQLRDGNSEKFQGVANLSATGFGLIAEGPFDSQGSYLFSVRRSYLDFLFKAAGLSFIPQYWDFQAKASYRLDSRNSISFLTIAALDDLIQNNKNSDDYYKNSRIAAPNQKQYFSGLTWKQTYDKGFSNVTLGRSYVNYETYQTDSLGVKVFNNKSTESLTSLRADGDFFISPNFELSFGNIAKYNSLLDYNISIPGYMRKDMNGVPSPLNVDSNFTAFSNSTYASLTTNINFIKLTIGGRSDYYNYTKDKLFLSPRISATLVINPISSIVLSAGRYYQPPSFIWLIGDKSNDLNPITADQIVLGYEHTPMEDLKVQLEVYYKKYSNYPERVFRPQAVLSPAGFEDLTTDIPNGLEPLISNGKGYSRGIELFIQKKLSEIPLYGLMSISVGESKFESIDGIERPGLYDARVIFNISAGYRFNSEWEISAKQRFSSGAPTTPFNQDGSINFAIYNAGERLPNYHALDFRIDKKWYYESMNLNLYLDIQNVYANKNISGYKWNQRKNEVEAQKSIGILPSIGVNWQF